MKMITETKKKQRKALLYLTLGLGICACILLINRFIIDIPDWIAIGLMVIVIVLMFIGYFNLFQRRIKK